jgi:hypothetical protein
VIGPGRLATATAVAIGMRPNAVRFDAIRVDGIRFGDVKRRDLPDDRAGRQSAVLDRRR